MNVSDKLAEWLADNDITQAFGIVGAGNVAIFDAIHRLGKTAICCTHHEQAAVMAACYYYRICGKLSVALVTTGAGSTNAITGVAAAFMDSIPVIVISGNEPSKYFEMPHPRVVGVQGYTSSEVAKKVTKFSGRMPEASFVIDGLRWAKKVALRPRMGPCWVDIPRDIQVQPC